MSLLQTILMTLLYVIGFILFWVVVIFFHELGHWLYYRIVTKKKPKVYIDNLDTKKNMAICVGTEEEFASLKTKQKIKMLLAGIATGLIPLMIFYSFWLYLDGWGFGVAVQLSISIGWYLLGTQNDWENILVLRKRLRRTNGIKA